MRKKTTIFLVIAVILILLISIILYRNITKEEKNENENFKIVTTFYPIYIMAANITQGAENVELTNMTDTNIGCLHDYTLTTSDMKKLEKYNDKYFRILQFYRNRLVNLGDMRVAKNTCKTGKYELVQDRRIRKEIQDGAAS